MENNKIMFETPEQIKEYFVNLIKSGKKVKDDEIIKTCQSIDMSDEEMADLIDEILSIDDQDIDFTGEDEMNVGSMLLDDDIFVPTDEVDFLMQLPIEAYKKYKDKIINVHPSLIPSFCGKGYYGLKVHEEALKYGVKVTGATVHFVNEIPDGGKIIMQKAVCIEDGDTPEILQKRVMREAEWIILPASLQKIANQLRNN